MPTAHSAGLLMYRFGAQGVQVLLAHPGGPYWTRKDDGAWTLPKGEYAPGADPLVEAQREFQEETGWPPQGPYLPLGELRQKSGKRIRAWAFEGDCDVAQLRSNTFEMEWPPRSGRMQAFAEIDRAAWFTLQEAYRKLIAGQLPFLDALQEQLRKAGRSA